MSKDPGLSIIIPLYNHEKYIKKAIESVIKQTYPFWELIIIDDGSLDRSAEIAEEFQDKRIRLFRQKNTGAHQAINRGLEMAKGEYIAILNSDDIYEKKRFEIMLRYMQEHTEVGFSCSYLHVINEKGRKLGVKKGWNNMEPWLLENPQMSFQDPYDFKKNLFIANFISTTSNFLFRRSLYEKIGGMRNLRFAHDWDFALRAAEATQCKIIEQPLMRYRVHEANTITSNRKWMLFEIVWIWAANLKRFFGTDLFTGEHNGQDLIRLAESLQLQGNDKVFWLLLLFIEAQEKKGIKHAEEILVEVVELRDKLMAYIVI